MNYIVQIYQAIPPDMLALLLGAIGASAIQQKVKNWLELENPKVLVLLTTVFSFAAAVIPAALGFLSANPAALGTHTAMFFTGMTLAFRYIIQPGSNQMAKLKEERVRYNAYKARQVAQTDGVSVAPLTITPTIDQAITSVDPTSTVPAGPTTAADF